MYKDHKRLYFNEEMNSWFQTPVVPVANSDSEISPPTPPDVLRGPSVLQEPVHDVALPPDTQSARVHSYGISLGQLDVYM